MPSNKQLDCSDYHVAWICPVADLELLPARLMLDEEHPTPTYDTHYDENTYICGSINGHAVVVATCPPGETGNVNAGRLTASMFKTFPNIRMAVLVGIGGGIPRPEISEDALENLHLGDVVVGWPGDGKPACVYHDRGRAKVDGQFEMVGTMGNPDWRLTNALGVLISDDELGLTGLQQQLARLQRPKVKKRFAYPGHEHDKLFNAAYRHTGDYQSKCAECDQSELIERPQRSKEERQTLVFHRGRIATGNAVIQDGEQRDKISARCDGALCVEMEAAGVDVNRRCLVIRGISDYADSHKSDMWRSYAAGNAAAFTRELLCRVQPATVKEMQGISEGVSEAPFLVPFVRPSNFVGREPQLAQLHAHILSEGCRRLAIHGLGGCGKTALALETAYRTREKYPACAIFWVPAISQETFEQAYREMGLLLRIPGITDPNADVKQLVKARLSDESFKSWLMIIDNADDDSVLFESPKDRNRTNRLFDYIPLNRRGSIIFTTRTRKAAVRLAGANLLQIKELNEVDAKSMLDQYLHKKDLLRDDSIVHDFLELLTYLPLAIVQAMAFVIGNDIQLSEYINIYKGSDKDATDLLSKDFEDMGRYPQTENPVATTWYISFNRIREQNKLAAEYLSQMAFTTGEAIPVSLLRHGRTQIETTEALGTLTAYAFVTERQQQRSSPDPPQQERMFDMHQLVRLATCNWLREHDEWHFWTNEALTRLIEIVPYGDQYTWRTWITYLPHAVHVVDLPEVYHKENRVLLLQNVGACEYALGRYTAAERIERLVVERRQCMFGIQHPYTLWSMRSLATTLLQLYKYTEAEQILRETLTLQTKLLGKEHRDTLQCSQDLAEVLRQQSKHLEAEKILQETLTLQEKTLGKAHFDTLWSSSYLELVFVDQGKYVEAEMSIRNTLALREMTFGKESLETLKSRHYLGRVLDEQKKYEEAEVVYRHSATLHKKIFGEEHPETLKNISRLGSVLYSQGKYEEAEVIFREAVESSERSSGGDHFDTLVYTLSYATIIRYQHRYDEALPFYERAFIGFRKTLGIQHQQTQNCLYYWDHTRLLAAARLSESEKQDIIYELAQGYRSVPRNSRKFVRASRPRANSVHSEGPSKRERVLRPRARTVVGSHENWDCMNGTR